jgi:DNA-binding NarL/FixJ family response regulator
MTEQTKTMKIRVLVADGHLLILDGVSGLLAKEPDMELLGTAEDGEQAVLKTQQLQPDVILMDVRMPNVNGIEATRQIKAQNPNVAVLCMSVHHEKMVVDAILKAGASGYILKGSAGTELASAIRAVSSGKQYFCKTITRERNRVKYIL